MSGKFMMNGIEYLGGSSGGGGGGNVDDVKVNGVSVVDTNKEAQITSYKELTLAEYQALPSSKLSDGVMYCISDVGGADSFPPLIYSDEEREVGVWRDGKPLYQKTISLGIMECDDSWHSVPHNIQNFERLVSANTIAGNILNEFYVAPTLRPTQTNGINIGADPTYIRYMNTWMSNGKDTYITIQYTKTTDTAGSGIWTTQGGYAHHYSETEQVIGTWINGKPIYEIVYTGLSMSNPGGWITPNVSLYPDTCISGMAIDSFNQCHIMDVGKDSNGHVTVRFPVTGNTMTTLIFQYTKAAV